MSLSQETIERIKRVLVASEFLEIKPKGFLGKGVDGSVYIRKEKGREVAVKEIKISRRPDNGNFSEGHIRRIMNEVFILSHVLQHCTGCVRLKRAYRKGNFIYIVLEYLKGYVNGKQYIDNYKFVENDRIIIFKNLIRAFECIHDNGVAHIDLKLENIMINPSTLEVKVIDFGCSCVVGDRFKLPLRLINNLEENKHNAPCKVVGNPIFMSPQFIINKLYDLQQRKIIKNIIIQNKPEEIKNYFKSDIWSLGIIGYILYTNTLPYIITPGVGEKDELIEINTQQNIPNIIYLVSKIKNKNIREILKKCLALKPEDRATIQELSNRLKY